MNFFNVLDDKVPTIFYDYNRREINEDFNKISLYKDDEKVDFIYREEFGSILIELQTKKYNFGFTYQNKFEDFIFFVSSFKIVRSQKYINVLNAFIGMGLLLESDFIQFIGHIKNKKDGNIINHQKIFNNVCFYDMIQKLNEVKLYENKNIYSSINISLNKIEISNHDKMNFIKDFYNYSSLNKISFS